MVKKGAKADRTEDLQRKLIENIIDLQKINLNMADKFDRLSRQLANLLSLFELAARSFAQQPSNISTEKDKEFLEKIDKLIDQNKTIAKGLTIMEDRIKERVYGPPVQTRQGMQQMPQQAAKKPSSERSEEMKPSLNSRPLPRI